jgi:hypothetical protein
MMDIADTNALAVIAFTMTLIAALLTYIAFFKEPNSSAGSSKSSKRTS